MDNLNNIPNAGNWGDAASKLNDNFNKIKQAVTTIENTSKNNKGYFTSLSALNTAFPSPKAGQTAYVYDEASSTKYYIYNAVNGAWAATSIEAPSVGVDLAGYTKTGGSTKTTKEVDDFVSQLESSYNPLFMPLNAYKGSLDLRFLISLKADIDYSDSEILLQKAYNRTTTGNYSQLIRFSVDGLTHEYRIDGGNKRTGIETIAIIRAVPARVIYAKVDWDKLDGVYDLDDLKIDGNKIAYTHKKNYNPLFYPLAEYTGRLDLRFLLSLRSDIDFSDKTIFLQQAYNMDLSTTGGDYSQFIRLNSEGREYSYRIDGGIRKTGIEVIELTGIDGKIYAKVDWDKLEGAHNLTLYIDSYKITTISTGGGESYDQSLNTFDDVAFKSISADTIIASELNINAFSFDFPTGNGTPPEEVEIGDAWIDTSDGTLKIRMQ